MRESMREELQIPQKELFLINYKRGEFESQDLATQSLLDHYAKYYQDAEVTIIEKLGNVIPKNIQVFKTSVYTSRCYVSVTYEVQSQRELSEQDFNILRAVGTFMGGQATGQLVKSEFKDGLYIYELRSDCDSGD